MARLLNRTEAIEFISSGTRTGHLATMRADGRPHVAPIWFVVDGGDVVFNTWHASVKGQNLQREGRAALSVDEPEPPYAFVVVEGAVVIEDVGPAERIAVATRIGGRYMGEARAAEFGARNGVEGELVCRLAMEHVVGRADMAG